MILYSSNAPSIALYIYIFLFLALSLYISDIARNQQVSFFYDLMSASRDTLNRICFILIMASLVGTPLTTGFFYKMHIFSTLSLQSPLTWFGATIINLILLVFYLQVIRHPQVSRKLRIRRFPWSINTASKSTVLTVTAINLFAIYMIPIIFEILISLFL